MIECETCPFKFWPAKCFAASTSNRRLCRLAVDQPGYRSILDDRTRKPVSKARDPRTVAALATIDAIRRVKQCEYRTNVEVGCSAGCATCIRPDRAGKVTMQDCLVCLAEGDPNG